MVAGRMNAFSRNCRDAVIDDLLPAWRGEKVPPDGRAGTTAVSWWSPPVLLKFAVEYAAAGSFAARVVADILARLGGATSEDPNMKAMLDNRVIAESDDIVECDGYHYFPSSAVRLQWLEKAPKTESDRACPHGVQFYDVVVDGTRHDRAAWSYEAPRPAMQRVAERFGFWKDVQVA